VSRDEAGELPPASPGQASTLDLRPSTDYMERTHHDLHSDDFFMREALRQGGARLPKPVDGAGRCGRRRVGTKSSRGRSTRWEQLKDATAHAEMLALTQAEGNHRRLAADGLHTLRDQGTVPDVRGRDGAHAAGARGVRRKRSERRCGGRSG